MFTILSIIFISLLTFLFFSDRNLKIAIIALVICSVSIGWVIHFAGREDDVEKVATIYVDSDGNITEDTTSLYLDKTSGNYFVYEFNDWNFFNPSYRKYLDPEKAEKYIEAYNQFMGTNPY